MDFREKYQKPRNRENFFPQKLFPLKNKKYFQTWLVKLDSFL